MSDAVPTDGPVANKTAGMLLREARIAQGMHIAAMAASIKVAQRKLELLEADRYDELPDATFTRALAKTMCRVMKIDAEPVLSRLPQSRPSELEHVAVGLNTPFRERPGHHEPRDWSLLASPVVWGILLLLAATVVVLLLPPGRLTHEGAAPSAAPSAPRPAVPASMPELSAPVVPAPATAASMPEPTASVAPSVAAPAQPAVAASAPAGTTASFPGGGAALQVRAIAASWLQISDAHGKVLISRLVQPGESLEFDAAPPLRARVGNAAGLQLSFRGQPVALNATRDNTANLELK